VLGAGSADYRDAIAHDSGGRGVCPLDAAGDRLPSAAVRDAAGRPWPGDLSLGPVLLVGLDELLVLLRG
jgi:hypothetical protein